MYSTRDEINETKAALDGIRVHREMTVSHIKQIETAVEEHNRKKAKKKVLLKAKSTEPTAEAELIDNSRADIRVLSDEDKVSDWGCRRNFRMTATVLAGSHQLLRQRSLRSEQAALEMEVRGTDRGNTRTLALRHCSHGFGGMTTKQKSKSLSPQHPLISS